MRTIIVLLVLCISTLPSYAQFPIAQAIGATAFPKAASDGIKSINGKALSSLQKKYNRLDAVIEKQSQKMLARVQRKENRIKKELYRKDSVKAIQLFVGANAKYESMKDNLTKPFDSSKALPLKEYISGMDSIQTALNFFKKQGVSLPEDKLNAVNKASNELKCLQDKLQKAGDIESYVNQREKQLKEQLQNNGFARQLKGINKETFYYSQRLREYKDALKSPEKMEKKLLNAVRNSKAFQSFMKRNGYLAKLFPAPEDYNTIQPIAGLQTRASVQQALQQRFGNTTNLLSASSTQEAGQPIGVGATNSANYLQQQMNAAQAQLSSLKDKMGKLNINSGDGDMTMPDFKPNSQHTKSFLQRIEYGINVQSEGSRSLLPATSEVAATAGYKLNDKSTIGVGASYRMGWGHQGFKHITVTNEGIGLRGYIDIKAKGSFWLSGGYEMNYQQSFAKYQELYNLSMWQRSGLIGITKKYKIGKKENNMQILWDFLSYEQIPKTQAVKFRIGFGL